MSVESENRLFELACKHAKSIEKTGWKENGESLAIAKEYNDLSKKEGILCGECGRTAKVTCNYH